MNELIKQNKLANLDYFLTRSDLKTLDKYKPQIQNEIRRLLQPEVDELSNVRATNNAFRMINKALGL